MAKILITNQLASRTSSAVIYWHVLAILIALLMKHVESRTAAVMVVDVVFSGRQVVWIAQPQGHRTGCRMICPRVGRQEREAQRRLRVEGLVT